MSYRDREQLAEIAALKSENAELKTRLARTEAAMGKVAFASSQAMLTPAR